MMPISLETVRAVASAVASEQQDDLQVVGVHAEGEYVEILLSLNNCLIEPCRVMVGISREVPPEELHSAIEAALKRHLADRRTM
jgi:hypothetical protein